jgi:hypothetical protein
MNLRISMHVRGFHHVFGENHAAVVSSKMSPEVLRFAQDDSST